MVTVQAEKSRGVDTQASVAAIDLNVWLRFDFDSLCSKVSIQIKCRASSAGFLTLQGSSRCNEEMHVG